MKHMDTDFVIRKLSTSDKDTWFTLWHEYIVNFYKTELSDKVITNTFHKLLSDDESIGCLVACNCNNELLIYLIDGLEQQNYL